MPMIREFQGKIVKRTLAVGDMIAVAFHSRVKGYVSILAEKWQERANSRPVFGPLRCPVCAA